MFAAAEAVTIIEPVSLCLAVNGRADVIVSADDDLLVLGSFQGIPIITAAAFAWAQIR